MKWSFCQVIWVLISLLGIFIHFWKLQVSFAHQGWPIWLLKLEREQQFLPYPNIGNLTRNLKELSFRPNGMELAPCAPPKCLLLLAFQPGILMIYQELKWSLVLTYLCRSLGHDPHVPTTRQCIVLGYNLQPWKLDQAPSLNPYMLWAYYHAEQIPMTGSSRYARSNLMIYIKVIHKVMILPLSLTPPPLDPPFKLSIKSNRSSKLRRNAHIGHHSFYFNHITFT